MAHPTSSILGPAAPPLTCSIPVMCVRHFITGQCRDACPFWNTLSHLSFLCQHMFTCHMKQTPIHFPRLHLNVMSCQNPSLFSLRILCVPARCSQILIFHQWLDFSCFIIIVCVIGELSSRFLFHQNKSSVYDPPFKPCIPPMPRKLPDKEKLVNICQIN